MPYITKDRRDALAITKSNKRGTLPAMDTPKTAGELNYKITTLIHDYLREHGLSYQKLNDCVGVLECAKAELYRRVVAPYEDAKMKANGDVML